MLRYPDRIKVEIEKNPSRRIIFSIAILEAFLLRFLNY
jgi:hypothetical protein